MKKILKPFLKYYLKYMAKLMLHVNHPTVIVVAGSANKVFASQQIKSALKQHSFHVRMSPKNFNTEFGLPLAILGLKSGYNSFRGWWPAIKQAPRKIFEKNFPEYLILSLGTSDPGDMKYLLSIVKPHIAVITDITQRYLESFTTMDKLVSEFQYLADSLPANSLLILNQDNPRVSKIHSKCPVISFGINNSADWQAVEVIKTDRGQKITIKNNNQLITREIGLFGAHHVQALIIGLIIEQYATDKK